MINKSINEIDLSDIEILVSSQVLENRTLEYKKELPGDSDKAKKEFLADVSSFANSEGGDIIFGVSQEGDKINSQIGIEITETDKEIQRLESIIRNGISPRCEVDLQTIYIDTNKYIVILRVKNSLNSPHRIIYQNSNRFFKRNSNGKYEMDVTELKDAFLSGMNIIEKIRQFRDIRFQKIIGQSLPVTIKYTEGFIAVHIIPLSSLHGLKVLQTSDLLTIKQHQVVLEPLYASGYDTRINLDGVCSFQVDGANNGSYSQMYRDGKIEGFDSRILSNRSVLDEDTGLKKLPMVAIERQIIKYIEKSLILLQSYSVEPPIYVFLSFYGLKDHTIPASMSYIFDPTPISENEILLPEILINDFGDSIPKLLKPLFDMVWNAAGYSRSQGYDENGSLTVLN